MSQSTDYVELRSHSWYSFGAGASSTADLVERAAELGYPALGLSDTSNLCGALEFSQQCLAAGVLQRPRVPRSAGRRAISRLLR